MNLKNASACHINTQFQSTPHSHQEGASIAYFEESQHELGLSKPKMLLVDDDLCFGKIMRRQARKKGIKLTYCRHVNQFLKNLNDPFDVAILDIDLGMITGMELANYLKNVKGQSLPIVYVSQTYRDPKSFVDMHLSRFVHKSFGPHALFDAAIQMIHPD